MMITIVILLIIMKKKTGKSGLEDSVILLIADIKLNYCHHQCLTQFILSVQTVSIDRIFNENGNIPVPYVSTGLLSPLLSFNDSINPISFTSVGSNFASVLIGPPCKDGVNESKLIIAVSSEPSFFVGRSVCQLGLLLLGPKADLFPSESKTLYVFPSPM